MNEPSKLKELASEADGALGTSAGVMSDTLLRIRDELEAYVAAQAARVEPMARGMTERELIDLLKDALESVEDYRAGKEFGSHDRKLIGRLKVAIASQPASAQAEPKCQTCNGHGLIGGPSYREPDEGGVPCPDCAGSAPAALDPDKFQLCRLGVHSGTMLRDGQPCNCANGTCRLGWVPRAAAQPPAQELTDEVMFLARKACNEAKSSGLCSGTADMAGMREFAGKRDALLRQLEAILAARGSKP
jgi:hypothetical protein